MAATPPPAKRLPRTRRKPTKPSGKSGTKASRIVLK
jgi:hypothetical protein